MSSKTKSATVTATAADAPVVATNPSPAPAPEEPTGPVAPPPKELMIPPVPDDFAPGQPGEFASIVPRQGELSALPQALADLKKFTAYDQIIGSTAPSYADLLQSFAVGSQWSSVRTALVRFGAYATLQEGLSWKMIRSQMVSLVPAFDLAAKRNPGLIEKYPGFAKMLGVRQTIAQKGASTRRANGKATANGEPATHGKVGKKRQRAAEKAAYAATNKAAPAAGGTSAASGAAAPATGVGAAGSAAPATPAPAGAAQATVATHS